MTCTAICMMLRTHRLLRPSQVIFATATRASLSIVVTSLLRNMQNSSVALCEWAQSGLLLIAAP